MNSRMGLIINKSDLDKFSKEVEKVLVYVVEATDDKIFEIHSKNSQ